MKGSNYRHSFFVALWSTGRPSRRNFYRLIKSDLVLADETFEDEDFLEMANAGLIPMIAIDSHKARFRKQVLDHIKVHPDIEKLDKNIHAGIKNLRFIVDRYCPVENEIED